MKSVYVMSLLLLTVSLVGCGGSSKDEATADSYLQFYNGAAVAGNTQLKASDTSIGSATYGDVSAVATLKASSYKLELTDVGSAENVLSKDVTLNKGDKTLFMLTQQGEQYDYLSLTFKRDIKAEEKFNLYLANLSEQYPLLDIYIAAENKSFSDATLLDSLSLREVSTTAKSQKIGKYNLYLTQAGATTPLFTARAVSFAYENTYVVIVRDKHGPMANQLSLDIVLNSSTVTAYNNIDAAAQFRLYNSLSQPIDLALDSQTVATVPAGQMSSYIPGAKGDYSLSVRDSSGALLLNSALLSLVAGDSKAVLLYNNAAARTEALAVQEKDTPQLRSHDVMVANLVADFTQLQFYFVRQSETISNAKYHIKNLQFKKQQYISLPKDYYAIALVQVAENGSTTLLDKTASIMLEPGKHYTLLAEKDDAAPSGYKIKLVY
jgi:hypothetical protein